MTVSASFNTTTKRWQPCWTASFNNFAGSGITIGSVDFVLWRGAETCSWFTTMTLNTTGTTERLANLYFPNN